MARKRVVSGRNLGIALAVALIFQHVFPAMRLGMFAWVGTLIVVMVAIYLLFF